MDLHRDDYGRLVRFEEDTETSQSIQYNEFMSFTDMKHCQGKIVSCVAFHPTWSGNSGAKSNLRKYKILKNSQIADSLIFKISLLEGIVALAYVDHTKSDISEAEETADDVSRNVYAMHPILIWSFVDAFRPKVCSYHLVFIKITL